MDTATEFSTPHCSTTERVAKSCHGSPAAHCRATRPSGAKRRGVLVALALGLAACGSGGVQDSGASAQIHVQSDEPLVAAGELGGPFSPEVKTYEVFNVGQANLEWQATPGESWITVSPAAGTLLPSQSQVVSVTVNTAASTLTAGAHQCPVTFDSVGGGAGSATRNVFLTINAPGSTQALLAERTSGIAPLSVVFDATSSGSGVVQPLGGADYSSFTYEWTYGDPTSGTWGTGQSCNSSSGFIGSHVFWNPGTYRVRLRLTTDLGTTFDYHQDITVTDADTAFASATFHVAANGNDGNPGTLAQPFATVDRAINAMIGTAGPVRILLRRGDTFTTPTHFLMPNMAGPYLITAYGTGARPQVNCTSDYGFFLGRTVQDLRVTDINFTLMAANPVQYADAFTCGERTTIARCRLQNFGFAVNADRRACVIADCEILNVLGYGITGFSPSDAVSQYMAVLGCTLDGAGLHLLRFTMSRVLVGYNTFRACASWAHALKQHGRALPNPQLFVCTMGNRFETPAVWVHVVGPQNDSSDEHSLHTLIEGNLYRPVGAIGSVGTVLSAFAQRVTVRNNIFDLQDNAECVSIRRRGIGPTPSNVLVEHNTMYRRIGAPLQTMLNAQSSDATIVRNNIMFCANGSVSMPGGSVAQSSNLIGDPLFADPLQLDYTPSPGSPAVDTASATATRLDFTGTFRSHGLTADIGAVEKKS